MCETIIYARDRWLKKHGGLIFPDECSIYINGIQHSKEKHENYDIFNNVRGNNYCFFTEPLKIMPNICEVDKKCVKTDD